MEDAGGRKRAWPQCRWAAAGSGRASRRRAQPHVSRPGIAGVEDAGGTGGHGCGAVGGGRACPGIKMTLGADQYARPHWCEGRRRGLAGHISDTAPKRRRCGGCRRAQERLAAVPVAGGGAWPGFAATRRAKLAAQTARGRAAAHRHTQRPGPTTRPSRHPEHQRHQSTQQQAPHERAQAYKKPTSAIGCRPVVELGGFEPPTFSLRTRRATNCAIAPRTRTA